MLDVDTAGMAWLVEHSADTLNKGLVGADGRTAYERVRGRTYHGQLYEFGQVIWALRGSVICLMSLSKYAYHEPAFWSKSPFP